jgi:hypothetical protein
MKVEYTLFEMKCHKAAKGRGATVGRQIKGIHIKSVWGSRGAAQAGDEAVKPIGHAELFYREGTIW